MIRDSEIKKRKINKKNTKELDPEYVDDGDDSNTTVEECTSVGSKKRSKSASKLSDAEDEGSIIPTKDFMLEIDANASSILDDFEMNEITVAEKIMTARKENRNSKNEILAKKTSLRTKKRERSLIEEGTNTSSEAKHVSSRTNHLEEVLKLLNLQNYWICRISLFKIRESPTNIKESSSNSSYN